jgi:hypothetical protein
MVITNKARIAEPVVILSLPRSYSSLACAMLGQHPQLFDTLETQLFEVDTLREWWRSYGDIHDSDGLVRVLAEIQFGNQSWEAVRFARGWVWSCRHLATRDVAWMLAEELFPLAMIEKTPIESASRKAIRAKLQRRLRVFPKARFIHLVRNPVDYGLSHLTHLEKMSKNSCPRRMNRRYQMMLDYTTDPPTIDPQVLWFRVNAAIVEFLAGLQEEQKLLVRGEDLISSPDTELGRIASWLKLRSDPQAIAEMKHPERSPFACLGPRNAMFGGDPTFFRAPALREAKPSMNGLRKSVPWRDDKMSFRSDVIELAERFGYHAVPES